jgi:amino acid transporter
VHEPPLLPSYSAALATLAAMLTAFCYAEYAAEMSVAGAAFNWVSGRSVGALSWQQSPLLQVLDGYTCT